MSRRQSLVLALLLLGSGFASLVYQVLWMRQLGLLFGSTAQSAGVTLAVFFAGLAAGSVFFGRRVGRSPRPLRLYAWLEAGIAATALTYFVLIRLFESLLPSLLNADAGELSLVLIKLALAALLIFPPAFCMGGTLPAMAEHGVRQSASFGKTASWFYSLNTLGAAVGVAAAAFVLVPYLGFRASYAVAVCISLAVAVVAALASRGTVLPLLAEVDEPASVPAAPASRLTLVLAFLSGFSVLALEVVWTRMFAQVHENSVYAFAVILVVVLLGLALGAWISSRLARWSLPTSSMLGVLLLLGGFALVFNAQLFLKATDGMRPVTEVEAWGKFVFRLFVMGFTGVGPVVVVLGLLFPYLMKIAEPQAGAPGRMLGRLLALNTAGAILGALLCGFVLLPLLGMWGTLKWIALAYLLAAIFMPYRIKPLGFGCRILACFYILLLVTSFNPTQHAATGSDPQRGHEAVLKTWEGSDCTVTVTEKENGNRSIKVNSAYVLGSTFAFVHQANQARIPLKFQPEAERVFFLGMGTGMSAAAALRPEFPAVKQVVTCELIPEVVEASKELMPDDLVGALYKDPRSTVYVADGRHHLLASNARYDMINADLFVPYHRGAGSLYSLEHYKVARGRLSPGGSYVQWLPLYQLTKAEFGVIARTMLEVFDEVTLWRNHFTPGNEVVAIVGRTSPSPLPAEDIKDPEQLRHAVEGMRLDQVDSTMMILAAETLPLYYAGNLGASRDLFAAYPINTDDNAVIEYQTPRTFREATDPLGIWYVGPQIADLTEKLFERCPPESDPVLMGRSPENRRFARAGLAFHRALIAKTLGQQAEGEKHWSAFLAEWSRAAGN